MSLSKTAMLAGALMGAALWTSTPAAAFQPGASAGAVSQAAQSTELLRLAQDAPRPPRGSGSAGGGKGGGGKGASAGGGNRGAGNRGGGHRGGGHRGGGWGGAAAVGAAGLAIGIIGAGIAAEQERAAVEECARQYGRRYDRAARMVYLRNDEFPCP